VEIDYIPGEKILWQMRTKMCNISEIQNKSCKKYGKIPLPASADVSPWEEVHVNLIGPWKFRFSSLTVPRETEYIQALTIMYKATRWQKL
jgi:hypothetical protein